MSCGQLEQRDQAVHVGAGQIDVIAGFGNRGGDAPRPAEVDRAGQVNRLSDIGMSWRETLYGSSAARKFSTQP